MIDSRRVRRLAALLGVACILLLALGAPPATGQASSQQEDSAELDDVSRIQVLNVTESDDGTVVADVAIPGAIGELAPVESNFGIAFLGSELGFDIAPLTTGVDVIIAIDTSGSMEGPPMRDAKLAAINFISGLPDASQVGVVGFGETVEVVTPLTDDREAALTSINELIAVGQTRLWDGLVAAAEMASTDDESPRYVVLLSDGADSISDASLDDAAQRLQQANVGLYAIAISGGEGDGAELQRAVEEVDGIYTAIDGSEELGSLYQSISDRLASRYRLTFNRNPGGRRNCRHFGRRRERTRGNGTSRADGT